MENCGAARLARCCPGARRQRSGRESPLIAGIEAAAPHLDELNPQLAGAIGKDLPRLQLRLKELGPGQSVTFAGVDPNGQDRYRVQHGNGKTEEWSLALDSLGIIDGAMMPL
jgi:hypothetical protein